MMKEQLISFKTAKLAKEVGFKIECEWAVHEDGYDHYRDFIGDEYLFSLDCMEDAFENTEEEHYLAPTQSLMQKWLREKHGIMVDVIPDYHDGWWFSCRILFFNGDFLCENNGDTYEEALEAGLHEALKKVKNES